MTQPPPSEVKGVWFVAARDYAADLHGPEVVERLVARSPAPFHDIYAAPIPSAWYPETAFEQGLIVIYDVVAEGNDAMFERIMEGCTERGINRLFRMLLRASSPGFVLRRVPTMWSQIRRGAGHVDVKQRGGETLIHYSEFPWFHNPLYRMLTVGSLRALVRCCTGDVPRIEITDQARSSLSLSIRHRAESLKPTPTFTASTRPGPPPAQNSGIGEAHSAVYERPSSTSPATARAATAVEKKRIGNNR